MLAGLRAEALVAFVALAGLSGCAVPPARASHDFGDVWAPRWSEPNVLRVVDLSADGGGQCSVDVRYLVGTCFVQTVRFEKCLALFHSDGGGPAGIQFVDAGDSYDFSPCARFEGNVGKRLNCMERLEVGCARAVECPCPITSDEDELRRDWKRRYEADGGA